VVVTLSILWLAIATPAASTAKVVPALPAAPAVSQSGNVISYAAAYFASTQASTAYDMIQRLPGFTLDDGSSVRGFGGAAGNVLIDGQRPTSKSDDLASILKRVPAAQVARIDLIRGTTPGIDMQGKTVVANVVLRTAGGFSGAVQLAQYSVRQGYRDPNVRLEGSWRKDRRSLEGSLLAFQGHASSEGSGPHEIRGPDGALLGRSHTRNSQPTWQYKATAAAETPLAGGRLSANLSFDAEPFRLTSVDTFGIAGRQAENDEQIQNIGELGAHFTRDVARGLYLELIGLQQLSHTRFESDFPRIADDQRFKLDNHQGETVGRLVLHAQPSPKLTAEAGGEYAFNSLNARTDFSVNGVKVLLPAANVRITESRGEAFGTLTWRPVNRLSLEGGLRVETSTIASMGDVVSSRRLTFAKPRLVLTWSPGPSDQFRIRIEREVGQLAFNQFVATASLNSTGIVAGNPDLLPQQDWVFEGAYEHHFWSDGVASVTVRRMVLTDVIDRAPVFAPSGVFDAPGNIGGGAETDLVSSLSVPLAKLGLKGFTLRGSATWRASRVTDPTTGETRLISGQHRLDADFHLTDEIPRWKISWGAEVFPTARERFFRFDEIDTNRIGGTADFYVDYKPRSDLSLRVQIFTTNPYEVDRSVFGGPRNLFGLTTLDVQKRTFGPILYTKLRKTF
jgi:hypothetical protein